MKRILIAAVTVILLNVNCFAQNPTEELYRRFEIDKLSDVIPYQAEETAEDMLDEKITFERIINLSPKQIKNLVIAKIKQSFTEYRKHLFSILSAVFLSAVLSLTGETGKHTEVFDLICVLSITTLLLNPVLNCMQYSCDTIREISKFMLAYIPIYTSIMISSGALGSAAAYQASVMAAAQLFSQLAGKLFLPLMQGYLLITLSGCISNNKGIKSIASAIKKTVNWGLIFTTTAFTGILSIQSIISSSADSAAAKTVKFLAGSFVPIIGGAFSDALSALQGSVRIIKASVGGFGIAVIILTFLPLLVRIAVLRCVLWLAKTAGELLTAEQCSVILTSFENVLSVIAALLAAAMMIFLISTAIMLNSAVNL